MMSRWGWTLTCWIKNVITLLFYCVWYLCVEYVCIIELWLNISITGCSDLEPHVCGSCRILCVTHTTSLSGLTLDPPSLCEVTVSPSEWLLRVVVLMRAFCTCRGNKSYLAGFVLHPLARESHCVAVIGGVMCCMVIRQLAISEDIWVKTIWRPWGFCPYTFIWGNTVSS